jgi:hypothetical protein
VGSLLLTALFYGVVVRILVPLLAEFVGIRAGNEAGTTNNRPADETPGSTDHASSRVR